MNPMNRRDFIRRSGVAAGAGTGREGDGQVGHLPGSHPVGLGGGATIARQGYRLA